MIDYITLIIFVVGIIIGANMNNIINFIKMRINGSN